LRLRDEHLDAILRVSTTKMKADLNKLANQIHCITTSNDLMDGLGKILNKRRPTLVKLFNVLTFIFLNLLSPKAVLTLIELFKKF